MPSPLNMPCLVVKYHTNTSPKHNHSQKVQFVSVMSHGSNTCNMFGFHVMAVGLSSYHEQYSGHYTIQLFHKVTLGLGTSTLVITSLTDHPIIACQRWTTLLRHLRQVESLCTGTCSRCNHTWT